MIDNYPSGDWTLRIGDKVVHEFALSEREAGSREYYAEPPIPNDIELTDGQQLIAWFGNEKYLQITDVINVSDGGSVIVSLQDNEQPFLVTI